MWRLENVTDDQVKSVTGHIIKIKEVLQISKLCLPRYGVSAEALPKIAERNSQNYFIFFKLCRSFAVSVIYINQTFDLFKKNFKINLPFPI